MTGKIYEVKKQYPAMREFEKRMHEVCKELNDCEKSRKKH